MPPPDQQLLNLAYQTALRAIECAFAQGESVNTSAYSPGHHQFVHVKATYRRQHLRVRLTVFLSEEHWNALFGMLELDYPEAEIDLRAYPPLRPSSDPDISPYCCTSCGQNLPWARWTLLRGNPRERIPRLLVESGVDLRCYQCLCAQVIREMEDTGKANLYLVERPGQPSVLQDSYGLVQFAIIVHHQKQVRLPNTPSRTIPRHDLYFIGPDQTEWQATAYAIYENHHLARARRLKHPSPYLRHIKHAPGLSQSSSMLVTGREPGAVKHLPRKRK